MTRKHFAWVVVAVEVVLLAAGTVMVAVAGGPDPAGDPMRGSRASAAVIPFSLVAYPLVGGVIAGRRRDNPIGWLLLASGFAWSVVFITDGVARLAPLEGAVLWIWGLAWWVPALGLTATILLQLFPDGRVLSPPWRRLTHLSVAAIVIVFALVTLGPSGGNDGPQVQNPYAIATLRPVVQALSPLFVLFPVSIIASVASVIVRYRRARTEQRQQIKWLGLAGAGLASVYAVTIIVTFATETSEGVPLPVAIMQDLTLLSFAAIPAAVGFAVLRYRLYDIDRIISRTLTYALVTGVLLAAYFGLVLALGGVARSLTGSTDVAVAVSTFIVAALFRPVVRRMRTRIDHRFNRARYDVARTIEAFTSRLRAETDLNTLGAELRDVVNRTMQPSSVSLWLRTDRERQTSTPSTTGALG